MMAAPPKPWESPGVNFQRGIPSGSVIANQFLGNPGMMPRGIQTGHAIPSTQQPGTSSVPPPLPPRQFQQRFTGGHGYNTGYTPHFGLNPYSSFSGYGMYGGNGYGMRQYGQYGTMLPQSFNDNSLLRMAEASSRNAFQSVESVVQAFGSVSMLLESTLFAFQSSFRAVIGVADQFSRLKIHMTNILSALAVFRGLRWLFRKVLYYLGLKMTDPTIDHAWTNAETQNSNPLESNVKKQNSWPAVVFFVVVFGGPWLLWKLLSSISGNIVTANKWATGESSYILAVAEYDFTGESDQEISIRAGQQLRLAPKELQPHIRGWLLGSVDGKKIGLIPGNYVKIAHRVDPVTPSSSTAEPATCVDQA